MSRIIKSPLDGTEVINFVGTTSDQNSGSTTVQDIADLAGGGSSQIQSNETIAAPYTGVELPSVSGVNVGDTKTVQFSDGTIVDYTWDGTTWVKDFVQDYSEERICLNTATPAFIATIVIEQTNVGLFFNYSGNPFDITSFKINGNELLSGNINVYNAGGAYVYTNQLVSLFNNWMATNGYTGTIDDDIDNNTGVFLTGLSGGVLTFEIITDEGGNVHIYADTSILITTSIPADVNNPTLAEVETWKNANLTLQQQTSGTILTYFVPGDGGSCENPDYTWTLNKGSELITLSNKRVFNTKTVYVDAGSGSDVTGRRGYREFPFKTLNAGINAALEGDLLYVFPGDYIQTETITKAVNIYCENGVNWNANSFGITFTTTFERINIHLDKYYNLLPLTVKQINLTNFESLFNLSINYSENIFVWRISANTVNINIKNSSNSIIETFLVAGNTYSNPKSSVVVDNFIPIIGSIGQGSSGSNNFISHIIVKNLVQNTIQNSSQAIISYNYGSDAGTDKVYTSKIDNARVELSGMYATMPNWDAVWSSFTGGGDSPKCIVYLRSALRGNTTINSEINNFNGSCGGFLYLGSDGNNELNKISNLKVNGYFKKGVPAIIRFHNREGYNFNIDLNVICDSSPGVYIWLEGGFTLSQTNSVTITGKIKTNSPDMPAITIISNNPAAMTNSNIILKNLLLINDGASPSVRTNLTNPQNIIIQNVKTNSLITDTNIVEIGESITRNTNYK
jgi:hypothetical protein